MLIEAGSLALTRDINGLVTHTAVGDIITELSYNQYGEPLSFAAEDDGTSLMSMDYDYNAGGQIIAVTETIGGVTSTYQYTHDDAGRLTVSAKTLFPVAACTYDSNSNRTAYNGDPADAAATYDDQDRMLTYGGAAYIYSDAGTLQTKNVSTNITSYDYDAVGNLRGVTLPDSTLITYLINRFNRRMGKQVNGSLVQGFIYLNQLSPIAELNAGGTVVSEFVYGSKSNVPQLMRKGGITYRIISDHLGSPRLVVNTSDGTIVQRMDYDAFRPGDYRYQSGISALRFCRRSI